MTKYCTRCGAPNTDDARFCVTCGNPFPQPVTPQPPSQQQQGGAPQYPQPQPTTQPYQPPVQPQQSRASRALDVFTKNLGLILPMLLLLIADLVLGVIVLAILVILVLHGSLTAGQAFSVPLFAAGLTLTGAVADLLFWVLTAIFASIVVVEARNAVLSQGYTLSQAWAEVRSRISDVLLVAVLLGVVDAILGLVPFIGWLLEALVFAYFIVVEATIFVQNVDASSALGGALTWIRSMIDGDPLSAVVLLVAAILSEIPIINFFTVPYAAILTILYLLDSGAGRPSPPPAPQPQVSPQQQ